MTRVMQLKHPGDRGWYMIGGSQETRVSGLKLTTINQLFDPGVLTSHRELHFFNIPNGDLINNLPIHYHDE